MHARPSAGLTGRGLIRRLREAARAERGALLAEVVVAIAVFTMLGSAVLSAMSTSHRTTISVNTSALVENLGRNQIETVLAEPYPTVLPHDYDPYAPDLPYEVTARATALGGDPCVARIVVRVLDSGSPILTLEVIRVAGLECEEA